MHFSTLAKISFLGYSIHSTVLYINQHKLPMTEFGIIDTAFVMLGIMGAAFVAHWLLTPSDKRRKSRLERLKTAYIRYSVRLNDLLEGAGDYIKSAKFRTQ